MYVKGAVTGRRTDEFIEFARTVNWQVIPEFSNLTTLGPMLKRVIQMLRFEWEKPVATELLATANRTLKWL